MKSEKVKNDLQLLRRDDAGAALCFHPIHDDSVEADSSNHYGAGLSVVKIIPQKLTKRKSSKISGWYKNR